MSLGQRVGLRCPGVYVGSIVSALVALGPPHFDSHVVCQGGSVCGLFHAVRARGVMKSAMAYCGMLDWGVAAPTREQRLIIWCKGWDPV